MPKTRHACAILVPALACLPLLLGCESETPTDSAPEMPEFSDQRLEAGRAIWMGTCRNCHLLGVAGAPAVNDFPQWEARLAKGKDALYQSALHGVRGDDGLYRMPPQGGNQRLSAEQVRLAVDYKMAAIEWLRAQGTRGGTE
jgi:cytochrome c5